MALVTIEGHGTTPTLDTAATQLGVGIADIDAEFGVVPLDSTSSLFSVRVRADRLPGTFGTKEPYRGPFSDPSIVPFGPIQGPGKQEK